MLGVVMWMEEWKVVMELRMFVMRKVSFVVVRELQVIDFVKCLALAKGR